MTTYFVTLSILVLYSILLEKRLSRMRGAIRLAMKMSGAKKYTRLGAEARKPLSFRIIETTDD